MQTTRTKELRLARRLTQDQLAERSGVGQSTIHRIEAYDALPTMRTAIRLADALEVGLDELFAREVPVAAGGN